MKNLRGYRVLLVLLLLLATICTYAIEVKVVFQTSTGEPIEGAHVKYLTNNWKNFGLTDENGEVTKNLNLTPGNDYSFKLIYDGQSVVKECTVEPGALLLFQTVKMRVKLYSSTDEGIGGGIVDYKSPGWKEFGVTSYAAGGGGGGNGGGGGSSGGGCGGGDEGGGCDGGDDGHDPGCSEGGDEGGCGGGGTGTGSGGGCHKELLPGTYSFRMTYEGETITENDVVVDEVSEPFVFHTVKMVVKLRDSNMTGLGGALVEFNSSGWKEFGITKLTTGGGNSGGGHEGGGCDGGDDGHDPGCQEGGDEGGCGGSGGSGGSGGGCGGDEGGCGGSGGNGGGPIGNVHKELLPGTYSFRMNWQGAASTVANINIEEESPLMFFSQPAVVKLVDEFGVGIEGGEVRFYCSEWIDAGPTDVNGEVTLELLQKDYLFEMNYEGMTLVKAMGINPNEYTVVFEWEGGELKNSSMEDELLVSELSIFPNPASERFNFSFAVEENCCLDVSIHDMSGKKINQIFSGDVAAGNFQLHWDSTNGAGEKVNNGIYLCRIASGNSVQVKNIILAR